MIKDPINITHFPGKLQEHFAESDKPFFWLSHNAVGLTSSPGVLIWSIIAESAEDQYYDPGCHIGREYINQNKERVVEFIESNYPNYLEWFLWNRELL